MLHLYKNISPESRFAEELMFTIEYFLEANSAKK